MTAVRRWLGAVWPLALLLVYLVHLATFRRADTGPVASGRIDACEPAPVGDVPRVERCLELQADEAGVLTARWCAGMAATVPLHRRRAKQPDVRVQSGSRADLLHIDAQPLT